jgi:flagellar motor switch protein FliN/FliY
MFEDFSENEFSSSLRDTEGNVQVAPVKFKPLEPVDIGKAKSRSIEILNDVNVSIDVQLGTTKLTVREILELVEGSIIELDRVAGDPVDVYVNGLKFASGEIVVINESYGVRINDLVSEETGREE